MKIVDLSLTVDNNSFAPSQTIGIEVDTTYKQPGHVQVSWFRQMAHLASHVDSPLHAVEGGPTIGEVPLEKTIGAALVLDLTDKCAANTPIEAADLEPFAGRVKEGDILILRTDWGAKMFGSLEYFTKSPYLTAGAARWLVDKKPKAVAFDFFEEYHARFPDFKPDDFIVHKILLGAGIIIIEGLTNLAALPDKRVMFFAAPLKYVNIEGAPARILAIVD